MRRYLPRYIKNSLTRLHLDLAADLAEIQQSRGQRRNYIAPRGSAKTTWLSKAYPMHGALEGIEPLTLLLAETGGQSRKYLDAIKRQIEGNRTIAQDYPQAAGRGPVWKADHIRLRNGCEIVARGAGGRILGITADDRRPTLVIVDDGNERGDAYSPTKRSRKLDWMVLDVLPVGEPGTNFVAAGTPIHREAIVCDLKRAGWPTRSYSALPTLPKNAELWTEWERVLMNLADPGREQAARSLYESKRPVMDEGAELLWPDRLPLYDLMSYRARYGEAAFKTEYTDDPGAPEGAEWPSELFEGKNFWFDDWPEDLVRKVVALDPSKGSDAKAGDYQAHAQVGVDSKGTIYVDCDLRHETPEAMVVRTLGIARQWGKVGRLVDYIVLEDNATMGLLRVAIQAVPGSEFLPWETLTQMDHKAIRIRVVSPYLHRRQIRVRNSVGGRMLVEQWREFPFGSHDDGPDAVATGLRRIEILSHGA